MARSFLQPPVRSCPRPLPPPPISLATTRLAADAIATPSPWSSRAAAGCSAAVGTLWESVPSPAKVLLLAFVPHVSAPWLLGATAAAHGVALAVVTPSGPGGSSRQDAAFRLDVLQRALQLLASLPTTARLPVILVDAHDSFVANAPSAALVDLLSRLRDDEVVLGGQCNIAPNCLADGAVGKLRQLPAYRRCHDDGYKACAPNADLLLGLPRALERLLGSVVRVAAAKQGYHRLVRAFEGGALQELYAEGRADSGIALRIDDGARAFLSLKTCMWPGNYSKSLRGLESCKAHYYNPLAATRMPNATSLAHWPRGRPPKWDRCDQAPCSAPLVVQTTPWAGEGADFRHRKLAPLVEAFFPKAELEAPLSLPSRPVLVIDPGAGTTPSTDGACTVVSTADVLRRSSSYY